MTAKKILIIQTAFIGDVILTTPLIERLHETQKGITIDFLTIPSSENLLTTNPGLHQVIIFDKKGKDKGIRGLLKMGRKLAGEKYDICLTPHRSFRSAYLSRKSRAAIRIGFDRSAWKRAFTQIVPYNPHIHEIERNLSLLNYLGIDGGGLKPPSLYATAEDRKAVDEYLKSTGADISRPMLAIAPGSVWATKRWLEAYFVQFCQNLSENGILPVLVGGVEDISLCLRISEKTPGSISTAGKFSLRQTYHLLTRCEGILTNDSAPLHIGMAAGIYVFSLFGPTVPSFGFAPFGPKSVILEKKDLACRPCAIHGSNQCPIKTFDCMIQLHPDYVFQKVMEKLKLNQNCENQ